MNRLLPAVFVLALLVPARCALAGAAPAVEGAAAAQTPRSRLIARLVALGESHREAADAVSRLTPQDVSVLSSNPRMMQRAGYTTEQSIAIILIFAASVALSVLVF